LRTRLTAYDVEKRSSIGSSIKETQSTRIGLAMNHNGSDMNSHGHKVHIPIEEAPLEIEELSPCELLRLKAAVRILTDYLLSLPSSIVHDAGVDYLDGNRYNLDCNGNGKDDNSSSGVGQNRQDDLDSGHKTDPTSVQRIAFSAHE
jgi:hypothetical protein